MMKKNILLLLFSVFALFIFTSCGNGGFDETNPTQEIFSKKENTYTISCDKAKDNSSIYFLTSYKFTETSTSISELLTNEEGNKIKANFTDEDTISIAVVTNRKYEITNASCNVDGVALTMKSYYSSGSHYYIWDLTETPKKNVSCVLTYDVVESMFAVTLEEFIIPEDTNGNLSHLVLEATLNGEAIAYNNSTKLNATNLYDALNSNATNAHLNVSGATGLVIKAYFDNGLFYSGYLGLSKNQNLSIKASYKNFYTTYSFLPVENISLKLDFTDVVNRDFNTFSVSTTISNQEALNYSSILVDGNASNSPLTCELINSSSSVQLVYNKSVFDEANIDYTKVEYCRINETSLYGDANIVTVDSKNERVLVTLKDTSNTIYPSYNWLIGSSDKDINSIPKNIDDLYNYNIRFITK